MRLSTEVLEFSTVAESSSPAKMFEVSTSLPQTRRHSMTTTTESTIPAGTWQSDPVHSTVGFAVRHAVGTFQGNFGRFEATLGDGAGEPRLTGSVPVESVQVKDESLEAHLLSPEFFDKDQAPEIRFESTKIAQ